MPTAPTTDDVFRGSAALRAGQLTVTQLRSARWRRLFRDVYLPAHVAVDHDARCRGAALLLPPGAAIAGTSAASLWGVAAVHPDAPVTVLAPPPLRFGPVKGVRVRQERLPAGDRTDLSGVPVTTAERTAWDLARQPDLLGAVAALDAFARAGLVDPGRLAVRLDAAAGRKGSRRARLAMRLMDSRAGSPAESRLRVRLLLSGVPAAVPQYEVRDRDGRSLGRVHLAWPERRLAVEHEPTRHPSGEHPSAERLRSNRLQAAGWAVLRVTDDALREGWPALVRQVEHLLARRA
jgi:transcriptional regulator with AbiEi antitoxin domain of type IV toxin-antitoxin system